MSAYACRYSVKFVSVSEARTTPTGSEVDVEFLVGTTKRLLTTGNPDLIRRLGKWNLADGAALFLYYSDARQWDLRRPSMTAHVIDKNFLTTDEEVD